MKIYPEDFWMTYKESWAPSPGWLSPDVAKLFSRRPPTREAAPGSRRVEATGATDAQNGGTGSSERTKDQPVFVERRRKQPAPCVSGMSRDGCAALVRRLEANGPGRRSHGRAVPVQDNDVLPDMGPQIHARNLENVVVLRPRLPDYTYADYVLSALRSLFEAQAAGQKELVRARIKLVSHLLEDIGRRRKA